MGNVTDTIVLDLPESAPYYDDLMKLLEQARADNYLRIVDVLDITKCDLQVGDVYITPSYRTARVETVSYVMARGRHIVEMFVLNDRGKIVDSFNAYADDILDNSSWERVSRLGETKLD